MGSVAELIKTVIKNGLYLAVTGQLASATKEMMFKAYKAQSHGIRMSDINRQLVGDTPWLHSRKAKKH